MQVLRNSIKYFSMVFGFSIIVLTSYAQSEASNPPQVTIPQGILQGTTLETRHGRNISAFLGIPYAQPPTGNLRFANPVAADGWNGTRDASTDANICPQIKNELTGDEDCLYLNVYTPKLSRDKNLPLIPTMVYIPGGAFTYDSAISTRYGPRYLLDADIVLVTVTYRLGPLGFLSTGDEVASGNWGLKDQVLALKWVQNNIKYFGGDPDQVTLVGESAGGTSVHLLTLSDSTKGLFHRYITQSGSALAPMACRPRTGYASRAFELGKFVGCSQNTSESLINCLRTVDSYDIIATLPQFTIWDQNREIVWGPTDEPDIKGAFLTDSPKNLVASGKIRDLPWISGVVQNEGLLMTSDLYLNESKLDEFLEKFDSIVPVLLSYKFFPDGGIARVKALKSYYFNNDLTGNKSLLLKNLTLLFSDALFWWPAYNAAHRQLALAASPQYFYNFEYRGTFSTTKMSLGSPAVNGVMHSDDLIYLLPLASYTSISNKTMSKLDYEIVDIMVKLWTSFAINGKPTLPSQNFITRWKPFSVKDNYLQIGDKSSVTVDEKYSFLEQRKEFWSDLYASEETSADTSDDVTKYTRGRPATQERTGEKAVKVFLNTVKGILLKG